MRGSRRLSAIVRGGSWLHGLVLALEIHGEEAKSVELVLNLHPVAELRAGALLLAHDRAFAVAGRVVQFGDGGVLELALILRIVVRVRLVIVLVRLFILLPLALTIRNVVITLDQSLSLTISPSQVSSLLLVAIGQHHHVTLKLSILLDSFQ